MTTAGFDCPEGTRLIIQRPDGYFTALVHGEVFVRALIKPGSAPEIGLHIPDEIIGAHISLDFEVDAEDDKTLWRVALGKYEI